MTTVVVQPPCQGPKYRKKKAVVCCLGTLFILNVLALMHISWQTNALYWFVSHGQVFEEDRNSGDIKLFVPGGSSSFCNDLCVDVYTSEVDGIDNNVNLVSCLASCYTTLDELVPAKVLAALAAQEQPRQMPLFIGGEDDDSNGYRFYYVFEYFKFDDELAADTPYYDSDSDTYDYSYLDDYFSDYYAGYDDSDSIYEIYSDYLGDDKLASSNDNVMILSATQAKIASLYSDLLQTKAKMDALSSELSPKYIQLQLGYVTTKSELWTFINAYNDMALSFGVDLRVDDWLDTSAVFPKEITDGAETETETETDAAVVDDVVAVEEIAAEEIAAVEDTAAVVPEPEMQPEP